MAKTSQGYVGWQLPDATRATLLRAVPPAYERIYAHHCTLRYGVTADVRLPPETQGTVVGITDDGEGLQCLVLSIAGTTNRWDGGTYHVTWSLAPGRKPVESNAVIERIGWETVPMFMFMPIDLEPKFFSMGT